MKKLSLFIFKLNYNYINNLSNSLDCMFKLIIWSSVSLIIDDTKSMKKYDVGKNIYFKRRHQRVIDSSNFFLDLRCTVFFFRKRTTDA